MCSLCVCNWFVNIAVCKIIRNFLSSCTFSTKKNPCSLLYFFEIARGSMYVCVCVRLTRTKANQKQKHSISAHEKAIDLAIVVINFNQFQINNHLINLNTAICVTRLICVSHTSRPMHTYVHACAVIKIFCNYF